MPLKEECTSNESRLSRYMCYVVLPFMRYTMEHGICSEHLNVLVTYIYMYMVQ